MLTEKLSKKVKFMQNNDQSEGVDHEAEDSSVREKKISKDTEDLNNAINNSELTDL